MDEPESDNSERAGFVVVAGNDATTVELGETPDGAVGLSRRQLEENTRTSSWARPFRMRPMREVVQEVRITFLSFEFLFCLIALVVGLLPRIIKNEAYTPRPIPYQETEAGDVLLELDLNYDRVTETVSDNVLIVTCLVLPWLITLVLGAATGPHRDAQASTCVCFLSFGVTEFLTDIIKAYCGSFRPNFYDLCEFDGAAPKTCIGEDAKEGYLSFPSGHASVAFCGMTFLTMYLLGKVGLERNPELFSPLRRLWYVAATALPMAYAFFVATSRVKDSYHHPADVVGGILIGLGSSLWAYRVWYPSVHDREGPGVPLATLFERMRTGTSAVK